MAFFLAVDAGGTKTDFVLADETHILARHRTSTIKRLRTDTETALQTLESGLQKLSQMSGVPMSSILRTCIGTAGETVPLVADWLRQAFAERVGGNLLLLGDVEIALDAAFRGGPGVLVLAGTGSNVAGRTPSGIRATCGGWGPMLADQGSGQGIGAHALRALFLAIDESRETMLQNAVLNFWNLSSIDLLIEHANRKPAPDVSRLALLVQHCADLGDVVAREILRTQGEQLGYLVRLLIRRLRILHDDPSLTPSLAFAGSIMERVQLVRGSLVASVQVEFPDISAIAGVADPIEGALWRARDEIAFTERSATL